MAKKSIKSEVALATTNEVTIPTNSEEVVITIKQLEGRLRSLEGSKEKEISLDVVYDNKNIKTIDSVGELVKMHASVVMREESYNKSLKELGLSPEKIAKWDYLGKSKNTWVEIIEKAIATLINKSEIAQIKEAIKELNQHVDQKTRLQNALKGIVLNASAPLK